MNQILSSHDRPPEGPPAAAPPPGPDRWQDLAMLAGDFAFETDALGRFVFVAPDPAFGWAAGTLLGQPAEAMLDTSAVAQPFNPFRPAAPIRRRRAWLRRPDGASLCVSFAATPLLDAAGRIVGSRGIGQDISAQDGQDAAVATSLRRLEVMDHILRRMRQEVLAPRMIDVVLDCLGEALGLEGAAVIDMAGDGVLPSVPHRSGTGLNAVIYKALTLLEQDRPGPLQATAPDGRLVLVCPCQTRFNDKAGLAVWRLPGGRALDEDDLTLASSATGLVRVILEHETVQREMTRQARTDPLTGLLNRRAFIEEIGRRIDRLERDGAPATLMFIDLDHFKALNDRGGHDLGDEALCLTAQLLRGLVRPQDLVARLGGDEFALWLDNTDGFAAAERAEQLRVEGPASLAHLCCDVSPPLTMSIGLATRWPGRGEEVETLLQRADQVMYEVKRTGRGHWRAAAPDAA